MRKEVVPKWGATLAPFHPFSLLLTLTTLIAQSSGEQSFKLQKPPAILPQVVVLVAVVISRGGG